MTSHQLEPTPQDTVNVFSAEHEPALTVEPGDTVVVRTLDAAGYLERQEFPGDTGRPTMFPGDFRGHCLSRPVAVRGAVPGDMLQVDIVSLVPDAWGWTGSPGAHGSPVAARLGQFMPRLLAFWKEAACVRSDKRLSPLQKTA